MTVGVEPTPSPVRDPLYLLSYVTDHDPDPSGSTTSDERGWVFPLAHVATSLSPPRPNPLNERDSEICAKKAGSFRELNPAPESYPGSVTMGATQLRPDQIAGAPALRSASFYV